MENVVRLDTSDVIEINYVNNAKYFVGRQHNFKAKDFVEVIVELEETEGGDILNITIEPKSE